MTPSGHDRFPQLNLIALIYEFWYFLGASNSTWIKCFWMEYHDSGYERLDVHSQNISKAVTSLNSQHWNCSVVLLCSQTVFITKQRKPTKEFKTNKNNKQKYTGQFTWLHFSGTVQTRWHTVSVPGSWKNSLSSKVCIALSLSNPWQKKWALSKNLISLESSGSRRLHNLKCNFNSRFLIAGLSKVANNSYID